MTKKEIRTVKQEAERFMKGIIFFEAEPDGLRLNLPFKDKRDVNIYFYVAKRKGSKKFSLLMPVESTGLLAVNSTLALLQPVLTTYGLLLSQTAVIMEESSLSLHIRIQNMAQALIAIDGICRLWQAENDRRTNAAQSQDSK